MIASERHKVKGHNRPSLFLYFSFINPSLFVCCPHCLFIVPLSISFFVWSELLIPTWQKEVKHKVACTARGVKDNIIFLHLQYAKTAKLASSNLKDLPHIESVGALCKLRKPSTMEGKEEEARRCIRAFSRRGVFSVQCLPPSRDTNTQVFTIQLLDPVFTSVYRLLGRYTLSWLTHRGLLWSRVILVSQMQILGIDWANIWGRHKILD